MAHFATIPYTNPCNNLYHIDLNFAPLHAPRIAAELSERAVARLLGGESRKADPITCHGIRSKASPRSAEIPNVAYIPVLFLPPRPSPDTPSSQRSHFAMFRATLPRPQILKRSLATQVPTPTAQAIPNTRRSWTKDEIQNIYDAPLLDLVFRAATVHRANHDANKIQLCTLMNIKST